MDLTQLKAMIDDGQIKDSKTIMCVLTYLNRSEVK